MNTQRGFSTLLGLLLVLAIAGGGAYAYTRTKVSNENEADVTADIIGSSTSTKNTDSAVSGKAIVKGSVSIPVASTTAHAGVTKKLRIYRIHDGYVYLLDMNPYPEGTYYKSVEVDAFKGYHDLEYVEVTADSFTALPVPEKEFVGVKTYTVDITGQINKIKSIRSITEAEFNAS